MAAETPVLVVRIKSIYCGGGGSWPNGEHQSYRPESLFFITHFLPAVELGESV